MNRNIQIGTQTIVVASMIIFAVFSQTYKSANRDYTRFQYGGLSFSHLFLFTMLGMAFPDQFWPVQLMGILFELSNYVVTKIESPTTKKQVLDIIGGSFAPGHGYIAEVHWLDCLVFGEYPTDHWWHPKVTDVILNAIGFIAGRWFILHAIGK